MVGLNGLAGADELLVHNPLSQRRLLLQRSL